jgi:hypothetical protein
LEFLKIFGIPIGNIPWNSKDSNWKLGNLGILGMELEWNWNKNPKIHDFLVRDSIKFFQLEFQRFHGNSRNSERFLGIPKDSLEFQRIPRNSNWKGWGTVKTSRKGIEVLR